jgi:DinB family protein
MPLSNKTRELVDSITGSRQALLKHVSDLSEAQLDYRSQEHPWSISDVLHHLALTDEANAKLTSVMLKQARADQLPLDAAPDASELHCLDGVMPGLNEGKFNAPDRVTPREHLPAAQSLARLEASRARMLENLEELSKYDLRKATYPHPVAGDFNGYQWLLIAGGHESRHVGQIKRIKSQENFPSS